MDVSQVTRVSQLMGGVSLVFFTIGSISGGKGGGYDWCSGKSWAFSVKNPRMCAQTWARNQIRCSKSWFALKTVHIRSWIQKNIEFPEREANLFTSWEKLAILVGRCHKNRKNVNATQGEKQTKKRAPRSRRITFLMFWTPLGREGQFWWKSIENRGRRLSSV